MLEANRLLNICHLLVTPGCGSTEAHYGAAYSCIMPLAVYIQFVFEGRLKVFNKRLCMNQPDFNISVRYACSV